MAKSKRAKKTRTAAEFDAVRLAASLRHPMQTRGARSGWSREEVRAARDAQMRGEFRAAAQLYDGMMSEGAIFGCLLNRLAPTQGLPTELRPPNDSSKAMRVLNEADALFGDQGISISRQVIWDVSRALVGHGIGIGYNVLTPRADGSRLDLEVRAWPMEFTRWDPVCRTYLAQMEDGRWEPIVHGDGRWIVFQKRSIEPHREGAIIPLSLDWLDMSLAKEDRGLVQMSHGSPKIVGTLAPGIPIDSPDGLVFQQYLANLHEALPYGIAPNGSTVQMLVNTSTAWQIFSETTKESLASAARVLLGNDGLVKSAGGNYIKDGFIWGIRNDLVESDLTCIERSLFEGAVQVWAALNFGDSDLAPYKKWLMPDVDEDQRRASLAERTKAYHEALKAYRDSGMVVDQEFADALAKEFGVRSGKLAVSGSVASPSETAPGTEAPVASETARQRVVELRRRSPS